ncbi:MAG TPA: hypothetical protein VLG50_08600, partial [Candidatus Saccharimonadales bacterium]|nr:hypothetical protein [Candidatus Saccharimonadales bacterium]
FDDETPQPQDNDHHIQHNKPNIHDITGAQGLLDMPDYPRDQFCKNLTLPQLAVVTTLYCVTVPFLFSIPVWLAHTAVEALTKS